MVRHASATEALACVQSGMRVFIHGGAATPTILVEALVAQAERLQDVELIHIHVSGKVDYARPDYARSFRVANLFVGHNMRPYVGTPRVDYLPCFLSEIPNLFRSGRRPLDVALLHVSPPDEHGFCTLGVSVDVAQAAAECAKVIVAQVNPQMPRVHGDGFIHMSRIHHWVEVDTPIPEFPQPPIGPEEAAIGRFAAEIIEDGATLQMGIGGVPDAVLSALKNHRHLGIHTEMMSDGVLALIHAGVVDNTLKKIHPGKVVVGFVTGTRKVYDYIDDNPQVAMLDIAYINNPTIIARNPQGHGHQQRRGDRPDRSGLRGQRGPPHHLRRRRPDGLHPRRLPVPGRQAHHRPPQPHQARRVPPGAHTEARCRRGDHPSARALRHHGIRRGGPLRPHPPRAGPGPHPDRPPRGPRGPRARLEHGVRLRLGASGPPPGPPPPR